MRRPLVIVGSVIVVALAAGLVMYVRSNERMDVGTASAGCSTAPPGSAPATTPQQVFDSMLHDFCAHEADGVHATWQWRLSGRNGGDWYIVVDDRRAVLHRGRAAHADVTFRASDEDWVKIANGDENGVVAYVRGRFHIDGSHSLARRLDVLFP